MEELENSMPMGGEGEIVEEEELELPNLSDVGSPQLEALKQSQEGGGILNQLSEGIQNTQAQVRDFIDNTFQGDQRSLEEIKEDRQIIADEGRQRLDESQQVLNASTNPVAEGIRSTVGGTIDAAESVGSFLKLSKDTMETGLNTVLGKAVNPEENPFSEEYQGGSYFEIPDIYEPENTTNIGKFARGLVEFGLLTRWTGGVGGLGVAKTGITKAPLVRSAGAFIAGNKPLQFLAAGAKISAEGGLAELISESSEYANIANLAQEYTPWLLPGIMQRLAIDENDTAWEARLKTVTAGAGLNHVGYFFAGLIRGGFKTAKTTAKEAIKKGKSVQEAIKLGNDAGTKEFKRAMLEEVLNAERGANKLAEVKLNQGVGIDPADPFDKYIRRHLDEEDLKAYDNALNDVETSNLDQRVEARGTIQELQERAQSNGSAKGDVWNDDRYSSTNLDSENAGRQPDPTVNPDQFDDYEKVSYVKEVNAVENVVDQAKKSPDIQSTLFDEADILKEVNGPIHNAEKITKDVIKRVSGGDKNLEEIFTEVIDDITEQISQRYSNADYEDLAVQAVKRAEPILQRIGDFTKGDVTSILNTYKSHISTKGKLGTKEYRRYSYGGGRDRKGRYINTIGPIQKDANMIILKSLAQTMSNLATGSLQINNKLSVMKNFEKLADLMKVVTIKTKEYTYAWGMDGQLQQGNVKILDKLQARKRGSAIKEAADDADKLHENLIGLVRQGYKTGDMQPVEDLITIFHLSDGNVLAIEDIATYLKSRVFGGSFMGYTGKKGQRFKTVPSKLFGELSGVMFNGLLARAKTPVKAISNTGFLAVYPQVMKALAFISPVTPSKFMKKPGFQNPEQLKRQTASALFQLEAATKNLSDSLSVFIRNYQLGLKGKDMDYVGKYAIQRRSANWKGLEYFKNKYAGDKATEIGWWFSNLLHDFNTHPIVRHSTIAMGAGDAAARYNIGMQRLAEDAFNEAMELGVDIADFRKFQPKFEELFEKKIFNIKDVELDNGTTMKVKVVSDTLAKLGGDKATLTTNLDGISRKFVDLLNVIPGSSNFFKFLTPAVNGLKITFDHSPFAALLNKQYHAMLRGDMVELEKLGITERTLPGAIAEIEGKMQFGLGLTTLFGLLAMQGRITGDLPREPGEREMWQQAGIKPTAFTFGIPFTDQRVYIDYRGIEIWSNLARTAANLFGDKDILGETMFSEMTTRLSFVAGSLLVDNGPLSGLTDFANIFSAENPQSLVESSLANVGGSYMPFSGSFADFSDLIDGSMKELESINERIAYRASVLKPFLPQRYDIYNEERQPKKLRNRPDNLLLRAFGLISPIGIDFEKEDPVTDTLVEIRYNVNANLTQINGVELTGPEQSEVQRILATDPLFRSELERVINTPEFKSSLAEYKAQNRKVDEGMFAKDGVFGLTGEDTGGYNYKNEVFYELVDRVHTDAKERAIEIMKGNYADSGDPKSLTNRINKRKVKTQLQQNQDFKVKDINKVIKNLQKHGK